MTWVFSLRNAPQEELDTTLQENRLVGLRYPPHLALANATLPEQAGWRGLNPLLMQGKHIAEDGQGSGVKGGNVRHG